MRRSSASLSSLLTRASSSPLALPLAAQRPTGLRLFHASRTAAAAPSSAVGNNAGEEREEQAAAFVEATPEQQAAWAKPAGAADPSKPASEGAEGDVPLDGADASGDHEGDQEFQESPLRRLLGRLKWPLFWGVFLGGGYYLFAPDHPKDGPWYGGITKAFQEVRPDTKQCRAEGTEGGRGMSRVDEG